MSLDKAGFKYLKSRRCVSRSALCVVRQESQRGKEPAEVRTGQDRGLRCSLEPPPSPGCLRHREPKARGYLPKPFRLVCHPAWLALGRGRERGCEAEHCEATGKLHKRPCKM